MRDHTVLGFRRWCLAACIIAPAVGSAQGTADQKTVWSITAPSSSALAYDSTISLMLVANKSLDSIVVVGTTLQEQSTKALVPMSALRIGAHAGCATPASYVPARPLPVQLCVGPLKPGTYVGNVSVAAAGADPTNVSLTLYATSLSSQLLGAALIAAGVVLSWIVMILLRNISQRSEALMPASALGDEVRLMMRQASDDASGVLGDKEIIAKIYAEADVLLKELGEPYLDSKNYLPRRLRSSFGQATTLSAEYTQFLQQKAVRVNVLGVLAGGVHSAAEYAGQVGVGKAAQAAKAISDAAPGVTTPDSARALVERELKSMLAPPAGSAGAGLPISLPPAGPPTVRSLLVRQQVVDAGAWLVWAMLTIGIGVAALIVSNAGFGTPSDLIKCVLWGLGVQVAGQQLSQLAPTTAGTALNLSIPRG